ncbi:hypothetical protein WR25_26862 [Diploscapter pachys]|uniref:Uncharacterized protein n=1 Tax=Diploscapter pachys TaxID=2018661 RepID=A0A2A2KU10_9BILA|nr:hypothetical protein WR25_26862 [Diploscapter pachys]
MLGSGEKQWVRRPVGTRFDPKYQMPTVKHGGGSATVWGCFSASGVGPLVCIYECMDANMYKEILEKHMLPFAKKKSLLDGYSSRIMTTNTDLP